AMPMATSSGTSTVERTSLSLHDALPISQALLDWGKAARERATRPAPAPGIATAPAPAAEPRAIPRAAPPIQPSLPLESLAARPRSEEHTSELQSRGHLVCRLLLEKKKDN